MYKFSSQMGAVQGCCGVGGRNKDKIFQSIDKIRKS